MQWSVQDPLSMIVVPNYWPIWKVSWQSANKGGGKWNFGFASILCSFFFERVTGLRPRVEIIPRGPCDLAMAWWIEFMRRQGGGRVSTPYNDDFFFCWRRKIIALDGYPYVGIDFIGDPDMPLPLGAAYGSIGKGFYIFHFFLYFCIKGNKNIFGWCLNIN